MASLLMAACASPEVADKVSSMDHRLSCAQMEHEIRQAELLRTDAQDRKGFTFRNVVTTLTFFPITMGTYSNANEAMEASLKRQEHLMQLYVTKGCAAEGTTATPAAPQPIVIPIIQPMTMAAPMQPIMPAPMSYEAPTTHMSVQPVSQTVIEEVPAPRYSAQHIQNTSYLFE
ncbi:MAG: hypothetical protein MRY32_09245 [Rickettsiales bacterium]|nr:hypothetical protein [Rickettsiales bacterium]